MITGERDRNTQKIGGEGTSQTKVNTLFRLVNPSIMRFAAESEARALPVELWQNILTNVRDRADQVTLLSVSRSFQYEAQKLLLREIYFPSTIRPGEPTVVIPSPVIKHVVAVEFAAQCVRSLTVHYTRGEETAATLRRLLDVIVNLRHLVINDYIDLAFATICVPASPCFSLSYLRCNARLFPLFSQYTVIQHLNINTTGSIRSPSRQSALTTSLKQCTSLTRLYINGLTLGELAPAPQLRVLSTSRIREKDLQAISHFFPKLEYLDGHVADHVSLSSITPKTKVLTNEQPPSPSSFNALSSLRHLKIWLWPQHESSQPLPAWLGLVTFQSFPTLQYAVDIFESCSAEKVQICQTPFPGVTSESLINRWAVVSEVKQLKRMEDREIGERCVYEARTYMDDINNHRCLML